MVEKAPKTKKAKEADVAKEHYFEAVGRRKEAIARVRLYTKKAGWEINKKTLIDYFPILRLQRKTTEPLEKIGIKEKLGVIVQVRGGGLSSQAEAIRLGLARALVKFNSEFKKKLRRLNLLTRDSRTVERKKFGLKKARRAPQWKKR